MNLCQCNCGGQCKNKFINGHNGRGLHRNIEIINKIKETKKLRPYKHNDERKEKIKNNALKMWKSFNDEERQKMQSHLKEISKNHVVTKEDRERIRLGNIKSWNNKTAEDKDKQINKMRNSIINQYKNGRRPWSNRKSSQQLLLYNKIKNIYNNFIIVDNKYIKTNNKYRYPDILIKEKNIIIEYDGLHWHSNINKDIERDKEFINLNYKIIHYRGYQPNDIEIINDINTLLENNINGLYKEEHKTILQTI
jgi:very-short-patch-repair endonuclease